MRTAMARQALPSAAAPRFRGRWRSEVVRSGACGVQQALGRRAGRRRRAGAPFSPSRTTRVRSPGTAPRAPVPGIPAILRGPHRRRSALLCDVEHVVCVRLELAVVRDDYDLLVVERLEDRVDLAQLRL